jgi:hypothetical protein
MTVDAVGSQPPSSGGWGWERTAYANSGAADRAEPAKVAGQYLGRTYSGPDDLDNEPALGLRDVDDNVNCANFVWGCLKEAGAVSPDEEHEVSVVKLDQRLRDQGWTEVSREDARPGDVWITISGDRRHTELVHSNEGGNITLIGSNNPAEGEPQVISYDTESGNEGGYFLRAPG